jgi:hypothetical protein
MSELIIKIGAESKQFQEELDKISDQTASLEGQLASVAKTSGVIFAALVAEAGLAIHAFAESEAASNSLTQALQNQGIYSQELAESYKKQAAELQKLTGIDDDSIVRAQASLQAMIGQTEISQELTKSILDLSAAKKIDLQSATELIGKGIEGHTIALKKLGIEIDENLTKEERQAQIIERVNQAFGGQAEAANKGLGSIKGLTSAFGDLQEGIGQRLAPAFTFIIEKITLFFQKLADNKPMLDLIVSLGAGAAIATGLVTALTAGTIAFLNIRAAMVAAKITTDLLSLSVKGLVGATGIGLLVIIATELYLNWSTVFPKMQAVFVAFVNNIATLAGGIGKILLGVFTFSPTKFKEGFEEIKAAFAKGLQDFEKEDAASKARLENQSKEHEVKQNVTQKEAADKRSAEKRAQENAEIAARKAHLDLLTLQNENASTGLIELQKKEADLLKQLADEKNKGEREQLKTQLESIQKQKEDAQRDEIEKRAALAAQLFEQNEEFQALDQDQKDEFLVQNQSVLLNSLESERQSRQTAALQRANEQNKANNQFLLDQRKFGTEYANISKLMHNEIYQGTKSAFGDLAQLTQSSNSTLKTIGKVAAVANIIIKSGESAMNIYAGFSQIPIVGPALGIAGAAAAIAFGAEQVALVTSAYDGGVVTGGIPGRDSVPHLLAPGELITPERNFDEVVNAVAANRNERAGIAGANGANGSVGLSIGFEGDEAEKVITARQVEARALGTYRART